MADDDRTVLKSTTRLSRVGKNKAIQATWEMPDAQRASIKFTDRFLIGRQSTCDISFPESIVSRVHTEVYRDEGNWCVRDSGSSNGVFLDGRRIDQARLPERCSLQLGSNGPIIELWIEPAELAASDENGSAGSGDKTIFMANVPSSFAPLGTSTSPSRPPSREAGDLGKPAGKGQQNRSVDDVAAHYFGDADDQGLGDNTRMIRQAFRKERSRLHREEKERSKRYVSVVVVLALLLVASVVAIAYQEFQRHRAEALATQLFYDIKAIQLELTQFEERARVSEDGDLKARLDVTRSRLEEMQARYQNYLDETELLGTDLSEQDRLIFRVARLFGECEINMPEGFRNEVKAYIGKWQTTRRLEKAMQVLDKYGYTTPIVEAMTANGLPAQFLYVALQESGFDNQAIGPATRWGIAKGPWQMIPETATRNGLRLGSMRDLPAYDPEDQRFDFEASSQAAARYLRKIYDTDAQASGLLVIASYNWGPNNILRLIRRMPENPRDRNFWNLLKNHSIPSETYDYVFYIFSATVIGENPSLFGFDFDNPLRNIQG